MKTMEDNKSYQLVMSIYKQKYFISTIYREYDIEDITENGFETIIWDWDNNEKKRGKIIDIFYSGDSEIDALSNHFDHINKLNKDKNADEKEGNQK